MDDTGPVDFNESTVNRPLSSTDSKPLSILNNCIRSPLNRRISDWEYESNSKICSHFVVKRVRGII